MVSDLDLQIFIIGPLKLQNELLASYIEKETGIPCVAWKKPKVSQVSEGKNGQKTLVLLDCLKTGLDNLWVNPALGYFSNTPRCLIALFNMTQNGGLEKAAVKRSVRGIFYESDSPDVIKRGIEVMLKGELWFPRVVLERVLFEEIQDNEKFRKNNMKLTPREKEILMMVASGETNEDIAKRLCISQNTVKTHIYNIYSKISVPNRIQAALWAAKNL
jgi:DNA-binding NarL/FixJ family response regulator